MIFYSSPSASSTICPASRSCSSVSPRFSCFDVLAHSPAIHENPNILGGVLFSKLVELFGLEKFVSRGEKGHCKSGFVSPP